MSHAGKSLFTLLSLAICGTGCITNESVPDHDGQERPSPSDGDQVLEDAGGPLIDANTGPDGTETIDAGHDAALPLPTDDDGGTDAGGLPPPCEGELCPADITFFAMGDPQYGGGSPDQNYFNITALNNFPGTPWPEDMPSAGTPVAKPRGVLVAGDLTQSGRDGRLEVNNQPGPNQLGQFISDYGLTGADGLLRFPVYEGYGNHDFDPSERFGDIPMNPATWQYYYPDEITPSVNAVIERNRDRIGLVNVSEEGGHYSWDWGGIHFVNVNVFPGNEPSDHDRTSMVRTPRKSLDFLAADLAQHVGDTCRPVIIMSHYGFSGSSLNALWWKDEQREAFWEVAKHYNVIAYIHGHQHDTSQGSWNGMDWFNVGSPYYASENLDKHGHFTVFRVYGNVFEAADVRWSPGRKGLDPHFPPENKPNSGWRFWKTFKRTCDQ